MFEYLLPATPGSKHDRFQGSVIQGLVQAGYAVRTMDHTGHGQSDSINGVRCFFNSFDDIVAEAQSYVQEEAKR
jgi:alpha-beta hydrolase superfamily lysophospholipase